VARPREFDETDVLDRALDAFWARGYDATSIEHLVEATGLGRASLYGAFGDKEQLFRRVMQRYLARARADVEQITEGLQGRQALEAFLRSRVTSRDARPGCFLQMSATSGTSPPLVQDALAAGSEEATSWLRRYVSEAIRLGELAKNTDVDSVVGMLGVLVAGLTASAKAGQAPEELERAIQSALSLLFKANPKRT
jgi:TetR/AcrR family transcriptional regulator, transcriptional repressor for nem operon